jgi:hypothetical protein
VRILIRRAIAGVVDGIGMSHFVPGAFYDVSDSLGGYLVSNGAAEEVIESGPVPAEDPSGSHVFGGVSVAKPVEASADRPRRRTAPRRRARR